MKTSQGCFAIANAKLQSADLIKILTDQLSELYDVDKDQEMFNAYENFEEFGQGMFMSQYINNI